MIIKICYDDSMSFDLRLIESFVAVAETLNFSSAAERTNTVQSAISAHIKVLEQQVDRSLVQRGRGQPVSLTTEGATFLVQARRLLLLADQMQQPQGRTENGEPLRLGTTVTFALSIVPHALSVNASQADAPPVTVKTARSHELMNFLEQGQIDVALVFDQGAHPMRYSTIEADLVWAAANEFVQPVNAPLPLAFLDDARDLRRHAYAALDEVGSITTSLSTHPDPIGLRAVVHAGLAVTILPRPAIVSPMAEVGGRLGLPALTKVQVSVYANKSDNKNKMEKLSQVLIDALTARKSS